MFEASRKGTAMRWAGDLLTLVALIMVSSIDSVVAQPADPLAAYRAQRDAFIEAYRVGGTADPSRLVPAETGLTALVLRSNGETRARALQELGTVQRLRNEFPSAVVTYTMAAQAAQDLGLRDVAFE